MGRPARTGKKLKRDGGRSVSTPRRRVGRNQSTNGDVSTTEESAMSARRIVAMVLVLSVLGSGPGLVSPTGAQPAPVVAPPPPAEAHAPAPSADVTPARVSYSNGEVSLRTPTPSRPIAAAARR